MHLLFVMLLSHHAYYIRYLSTGSICKRSFLCLSACSCVCNNRPLSLEPVVCAFHALSPTKFIVFSYAHDFDQFFFHVVLLTHTSQYKIRYFLKENICRTEHVSHKIAFVLVICPILVAETVFWAAFHGIFHDVISQF